MRRALSLSLLSFALVALTAPAWAVPAPMGPKDLEAAADIVVEAEITSVSCDGEAQRGDGVVISNYRSTARVLKVLKGKPDSTLSVTGESREWTDPDKMPAGYPPHAALPQGWRGTLYLKGAQSPYALVYYNGAVEDGATSRPGQLPKCARTGCGGCALSPQRSDVPLWIFATLLLLLRLRL